MATGKIAQKKPFILEMEPGTYEWCRCGLSQTQPFCDGSHEVTGFKPAVVEIAEKKKVAWCGCKQTGTAPFCDGTHRKLP